MPDSGTCPHRGCPTTSMKRSIGATAALVGALGSSSAHADGFIETTHEISVDLHESHATAIVSRTFATEYDAPIEAHVHFAAAGIATALRTRGNDGRWYGGELHDVEAAVDTYWKLTGSQKVVPGIVLPRQRVSARVDDPALLMWSPTGLDLYAYPVTIATPRSVEYTLQIPYEYADGADRAWIATGEEQLLAPRVRIASMARGMIARIAGERVVRGSEVDTIADEGVEILIERARPQLAIDFGTTRAGQRWFSRVSVQASSELGRDPARTHAVIVLDRSRSMGPDSMNAAKAMLLAYLDRLTEVDGAKVEIIGFDREVWAEHGAFVSPAVARDALAKAELSLRNGSALPGALALATKRLASAPRGAPRRAIVVSDATLAPHDEARIARSIASTGALVHLVDVIGDRTTALDRAPDHRLSDVVADTGGVVWVATVEPDQSDLAGTFDALVRPDRIDEFAVRVDGELESLVGEAVWLPSGAGTLDVRVRERAPRRVTAEGMLWGTPVRVDAGRSASMDREWTRLAAAYLVDELDDDEITDVARRSGAVSPKTALLALEPGVMPSEAPATVADGERRFTSRVSSCGFGGWVASGGFGRYSLDHDEAEWIRIAVAEAAKSCGVTTYEVALTTSYAEVLAVDAVQAPDDADVACLSDAVWSLELPPGKPTIATHRVASP
ncbi:MAG TPA: vWA domain-containing protein [Nannocystaceae bacterium]|nr:vWA domain-containing protein [Nannocystaceae bacterium]